MTTLNDSAAYLAEHYAYELNMLRRTYKELLTETDPFKINVLIESFCVHARALLDFYKSTPRGDDVVAIHFIASGQFNAAGTSQLQPALRERVNKQIAHLTASRENAVKIDAVARQALIDAIETDHTAFENEVDPKYRGCFANALQNIPTTHVPTHGAAVIPTGPPSASSAAPFSVTGPLPTKSK